MQTIKSQSSKNGYNLRLLSQKQFWMNWEEHISTHFTFRFINIFEIEEG